MMTDKIADMLIRIKNAQMRGKEEVEIYPYSKLKQQILDVLKREGFINDYEVIDDKNPANRKIIVKLKYYPDGSPMITDVRRVSKPGRRIYMGYREIPRVMNGLGIAIVSTSRGILSDREARKMKVGGEVLAEVW